MELTSIDPLSDPLWSDLLNSNYASSVFHAPEWLQAISSNYGFDIRAHVLSEDGDSPVAGFLYAVVDDARGSRIVSLPFSDYCDPLVPERHHWQWLVQPLLSKNVSLRVRVLDNQVLQNDSRFDCESVAHWHYLDLEPDLDSIWRSLDDGAKRNVRKAIRQGLVVEPAQSKEDLRSFFDLHLGVRKRKYGLLSQPYSFFVHIWNEFVERGSGFLLLARHGGQVVAGTFYLKWMNCLYYKFNASSPAGLALRPNDLLTWEGIVRAKNEGMTGLDFGLTDWGQSGLIRYKRKFASREGTITTYTRQPTGAQGRDDSELKSLLSEMTRLFTLSEVPDAVTEQAGDALYRYFA